jgi:hypothetical protein
MTHAKGPHRPGKDLAAEAPPRLEGDRVPGNELPAGGFHH